MFFCFWWLQSAQFISEHYFCLWKNDTYGKKTWNAMCLLIRCVNWSDIFCNRIRICKSMIGQPLHFLTWTYFLHLKCFPLPYLDKTKWRRLFWAQVFFIELVCLSNKASFLVSLFCVARAPSCIHIASWQKFFPCTRHVRFFWACDPLWMFLLMRASFRMSISPWHMFLHSSMQLQSFLLPAEVEITLLKDTWE